MPLTMIARRGVLIRKTDERPGIEIWMVDLGNRGTAEAVVYTPLVGEVVPGDHVLLNTTAVELSLGTGGQHFVIAREELGGPVPPAEVRREDGHIMKLRYTPQQLRVLAIEEEASPYYDLLRTADRLPGTPVLCLGLHSQLAPVLGGIKAVNPHLRVVYVYTDSAALPLPYSHLVEELSFRGLLETTITVGQAFGGDLEAVNIYSGLVAAVHAVKADLIIAGQGPGNVGTASPLGFGGVEQAMLINAVAALEGVPIAVPRISFADPRERHHGLSHHSITVLGRLALGSAVLPLPMMMPDQSDLVQAQLHREGLMRHRTVTADGWPGVDYCLQRGITIRSMGRGYDDDPVFFHAAAAAGRVAAEMVVTRA